MSGVNEVSYIFRIYELFLHLERHGGGESYFPCENLKGKKI